MKNKKELKSKKLIGVKTAIISIVSVILGFLVGNGFITPDLSNMISDVLNSVVVEDVLPDEGNNMSDVVLEPETPETIAEEELLK